MFTGDSSGDWVAKALYEAGFANQPRSTRTDDGLTLTATYISATVRCAPPGNKPTSQEIQNCASYLVEELTLFNEAKLVLTLGKVAFENYLKHRADRFAASNVVFRHGALYDLGRSPLIMASYHPSRQNTQTGKLTWQAWSNVFTEIRRIIA